MRLGKRSEQLLTYSHYAIAVMVLCFVVSVALPKPALSDVAKIQPFTNSAHDKAFLAYLRQNLVNKKALVKEDPKLKNLFNRTSFPKSFNGIALIIYAKSNKRIVIVRRKQKELESLRETINRAILHPRLDAMGARSRFQLDFIIDDPAPISANDVFLTRNSYDRFEIGVDGLRMKTGGKVTYFFPGDAFVRSIHGVGQLQKYIEKTYSNVSIKNIQFQQFHTESYVSYRNYWLRLFRGIPVVGNIGRQDVKDAAKTSVDFLIRTQASDGRFMYYYNAANDSFRNHEHPTRAPETDPYYNILRHSGGALTYLFHYEVYQDPRVLDPTRRAIEYLIKQIKLYEIALGKKGGYIFYNTKSKLGGSGIALYLLAEYQRLTGDDQYQHWARLLKNHVLNEIREDGEFYYYHIYPNREKDDPNSFSFYYPGEALVGLTSYYKSIKINGSEKQHMIRKMKQALQFLLINRKVKYKKHYKSLPSDSWLMMAINEAWDIPEMQQDLYKDFVFGDADQMVKLMYTHYDGLYPDYVGSFYYHYGNYPYPDGARAEGLTAAYELAVKVGDQVRIERYGEALKAVAWATLHLVNTPQSTYSVPNPGKAIGGIRFKPTRQWFRVDTIQHVTAFYLKFSPYWKEGDIFDPGG
jgi:hypothetical protein